ncbi:MAG: transcription-repair coupling factor [Synergistetes bacterium]|nr:transcription-repair coupling factor [Synergistota bacterium]MCX8127296.1 transcription-repair coupling factor [Synergistota bacterium]MDW8191818.1 transcription-repair coupling factor [Synergistota bacterium]
MNKSFIDRLKEELINKRFAKVGKVRKGGLWYIVKKLFNNPWENICVVLGEDASLSGVEDSLVSSFGGSVYKINSHQDLFSLGRNFIAILPINLALSRSFLCKEVFRISLGQRIGYSELLSSLRRMGYRRSEPPLSAGEFNLRGDVIEIRVRDDIVVISLYGDEIDYIGVLEDIDAKPSFRRIDSIEIVPPHSQGDGAFWDILPRDSLVIWVYVDDVGVSFSKDVRIPFLFLYREELDSALNIPWNPYIPTFLERELSFKEGDYVVHEDYGIGIFRGIVRIRVDGVEGEYLLIEYDKGEKLYVPSVSIDKVSPYIGGGEPSLDSLKKGSWTVVKNRVKKNVEEVAKELLRIYALRSVLTGYAFSKDSNWQKEFEARFEFDETPDQLKAIEEVKRDMESPRPMDRLICGDVGYGKTEVAFRAAFKAVMDGKQVAFLCPTTVLAFQHYMNLQKRMEGFPIKVAMLTRFLTSKEQAEVIEGIKKGMIDIVVGTHMLLSDNISFKDLGLVIIDEEQKFGVMQKEKLKRLRVDVDVLTMTATPIPRTLYLALSGAKDISVINTPPSGRKNVEIYVGKWDYNLVRSAIIREIQRGGQVFLVHNRVEDIYSFADKISKLVPEVRLGIAHGKMSEDELERVMVSFISGEINLLVCTTIIENGIDIPSANTIIVHQAENLGLSQLYQLRGRVGRGNRQAYAYFLYEDESGLTDAGRERLEAIREFGELGSSFKLALRDMQIRGVGNILGPEQHGFVNSVGFHLYCKMLEETIASLKGDLPKVLSARVDLGLDAYIPSEYIDDEEERLYYYRKLVNVKRLEEVDDLEFEFKERFGDIPAPIVNLLKTVRFKVIAEEAGVSEIYYKNGKLSIHLHPIIWGKRGEIQAYFSSLGFSCFNMRFEKNLMAFFSVEKLLNKILIELKEMREKWQGRNLSVSSI